MRKNHVRQRFCSLRDMMSAEQVKRASADLCRRVANWPQAREARTILTYLAFRNEPNLSPLFDMMPGIRWAVPRIDGKRLIPHVYDPDHLLRHRFGMLEPTPDVPKVDPESIDLVLVPGVAFDWRGGRIGFGGGYYDRFLPTTPALRVGITYECCLIDELPCEEYDQRMDWVMTSARAIHCAPHWREKCPPS